MSKPVAIVLGGTIPHIELIKNLKLRGYFVILIDYFENPPARVFADEHLQESTLDINKVLRIAKDYSVKLVISTCLDHTNAVACFVAEQLNLPLPYSYEIALSVTNKILMKKKMIENGIPTSKFVKIENLNNYDISDLKFPLIVKPADSNGSKGVRKVDDLVELDFIIKQAYEISRSKEVIVEEFNEGREIGVDCFITDNKTNIIMTRERQKIRKDNEIQQIYGSFWPATLSSSNIEIIQNIVDKIASIFKLNNTPLLLQLIECDGEINVIEFAARFGGGENFRVIKYITGFDIIDSAIKSFIGESVHFHINASEYYYFDNYIYTYPGQYGHIDGYKKNLDNGIIEYITEYKTEGMEIGSDLAGNNRVGVFTVKGKNKKELLDKIKLVVNAIQVYDINNNPIMRKDIYEGFI